MLSHIATVVAALFVTRLLYQRFFSSLSRFKGPLLASFTDLWKLWYAYTGPQKQQYVDVHRKYGDIVRLGPNELSFADPRAIHDIYGPKGCELKSESYDIPTSIVNGVVQQVLFSTRNITWHDRQRKIMHLAFSTTQLRDYEPWLDQSIKIFITQIQKRYADKNGYSSQMNLVDWFNYFSLDAICEMTFGERPGFLETGSDVENSIATIHESMRGWQYLSRMPVLDRLIIKNPLRLWFNRYGWFVKPPPFSGYVKRQFFERQSHWQAQDGTSSERTTLTDKFLVAQREHPEVPEFQPFMQSMSVVGAASESTGITLCSIMYFLLRNPTCYAKVQAEIDQIENDSETPVPFARALELPYLEAAITEAMRCHWIVRIPANRITPPGGMTICDEWIPGGVDVGVWGGVVQRNKRIFGDDADVFRPERWLDNSDEERLRAMKSAMFTFGSGKYGCLGKNLARLEIWKLIPTLLRNFEFRLLNPDREWVIMNGAFAPPENLLVRVKTRSAR